MCPECKERRDRIRKAWQNHHFGKAAKETIAGAAQMVGLSKTPSRRPKRSKMEPLINDLPVTGEEYENG